MPTLKNQRPEVDKYIFYNNRVRSRDDAASELCQIISYSFVFLIWDYKCLKFLTCLNNS